MKMIKTMTILCLTAFALLATGCSDKKDKKDKKDGWNNPDIFKTEDPSKYKKNTRQIK